MHFLSILGLLPVVLACTNPESDACASYLSANAATASAYCATFTQSTVTATAELPSWATYCSSKPSSISKECTCLYPGTDAATSTTKASTTLKTTTTATVITTSTGPATTETNSACGSADVDALVGYGVGTTGGGSGTGTTVTSCSELEAAIANAGVITISGVLDGCGVLDLLSDTTVIGSGSGSGEWSNRVSQA